MMFIWFIYRIAVYLQYKNNITRYNMKRYLLYLNGRVVKDAQRASTITKYYKAYSRAYNAEDNVLYVYDVETGKYILDNNGDITTD